MIYYLKAFHECCLHLLLILQLPFTGGCRLRHLLSCHLEITTGDQRTCIKSPRVCCLAISDTSCRTDSDIFPHMNVFPVTKFLIEQKHFLGSPGGSVVKNPPPNAGDVSTIPEPARSHMLWSNEAHALQVLSLCVPWRLGPTAEAHAT